MPIFIEDDELEKFVKEVIDRTITAYTKAELKLHSNILDPFSALFDASRQGITFSDWLSQEKTRQVQKTLQNAVGDFHQNVLGSVAGWHNPGRGGGYDLISNENMLIAEVKNKFNTMNSSSSESTYRKLAKFLDNECKGYKAYVVFIVPKKPEDYNKKWSPNSEKMPLRNDIRKIDGESFYRLVTGRKNAIRELYDALPPIISKIMHKQEIVSSEKELFKELFSRAYK